MVLDDVPLAVLPISPNQVARHWGMIVPWCLGIALEKAITYTRLLEEI